MTRQADFKAEIRTRMARTGERYATARAALIARAEARGRRPRTPAAPDEARLSLIPGYDRFGGIHPETATMANALRAAGVRDPVTGAPYDEPTLFGLSGGIGFMAFVFEYRGMLPMCTIVLRSDSYPEAFVQRGLERTGARLEVELTGSDRLAASRLAAAVAAGQPSICTVDVAALRYLGLPLEFAGYGPREVGVAGTRGDGTFVLDDRAPRPILVSHDRLAAARAAYRKGRHRRIGIMAAGTATGATGSGPGATGAGSQAPGPGLDVAAVTLEAIRGTIRGFRETPVKGFASNFGLPGLERWARLVGETRDARGWPRLFATPEALAGALVQVYAGIELEHTAPAGGRTWYAGFLERAADVTGRDALRDVAARYRALGEAWSGLAVSVLPDEDPARRALRQTLEERVRLVDELGEEAEAPALAAWRRRVELQRGYEADAGERTAILADLAARAERLATGEREALEALEDAVA